VNYSKAKLQFLIAFLLVGSLLVSSLAATSLARVDGSVPVSTSTMAGRLAVFDDVWATIEERYYDPNFHGVDWQGKRVIFRQSAANANGTHEFYSVLHQMIAALRDAHTRVYAPEDKFDWWNPKFVTVGLTIREVEGVPTVTQVDPASAAARAGIAPGDLLIDIDDSPVQNLIRTKVENGDSPLTGSARYRAIASLAEGPAESSVKLTWQTRTGETRSAELARFWSQRRLGFNSQRKGRIALIRLEAFTQSIGSEFAKELPKMIDGASAIILDLRTNGGGDAEAMSDIASLFLDDGINLGKFADRMGASFELTTMSKRLWSTTPDSHTSLPMIVLTSENTSSAAEIMAATLQTKRRARIVGTDTCGCVLAIRNRHALPDGGVLDVSEFDYRTAEGVRLEGRGVKPDIVVPILRRDYYERRDRAFDTARDILNNHKTK